MTRAKAFERDPAPALNAKQSYNRHAAASMICCQPLAFWWRFGFNTRQILSGSLILRVVSDELEMEDVKMMHFSIVQSIRVFEFLWGWRLGSGPQSLNVVNLATSCYVQFSGQIRKFLLRSGSPCYHGPSGPQAAQSGSNLGCCNVPGGWNRPGKVQGLCAGTLACRM